MKKTPSKEERNERADECLEIFNNKINNETTIKGTIEAFQDAFIKTHQTRCEKCDFPFMIGYYCANCNDKKTEKSPKSND